MRKINLQRTEECAREMLEKLRPYEQDGCVSFSNTRLMSICNKNLWDVTNALKLAESKGWICRNTAYGADNRLKRSITINWSELNK